jgi:hypothetical protein
VITPRRLLLTAPCVALAAAALLASAPAASSDVLNLSACNNNALSQVFLPWADPAYYELAPGGDFESASWTSAPWTLSGGASLVSGSEPFAVTGTLGQSSLSLPAGASAVSPATCVDAAYPDMRFFVAGSGVVQVNVIYGTTVIPAGTVAAAGAWAPSPITVTGSAIAGALNGGTAQVSIQLTALSGDPQVDDVYIDPWGRCC